MNKKAGEPEQRAPGSNPDRSESAGKVSQTVPGPSVEKSTAPTKKLAQKTAGPSAEKSPPAGNKAAEAPHRFVAVEGPIGVGKSSLARRLCASLSAEPVFEQATSNPFLERFYRNPRAGALPTQLYFLFQRAQQLAALKQQDLFAPVRVADYLLEKDRLFARVTLDDAEYALYEQVYAKLDIEAPKPDLVVYLQAPADVLLERIAKRGIDYEQHIERHYLERLGEAYARFFHEFDAAPLLIVNAATIDPINNQADYDELLAAIQRMRRGRLYYNPLHSQTL